MASKRSSSAGGSGCAKSNPTALGVLRSVLVNEGAAGLYKGFWMCWARLGSHTIISLVLFERFRALFGVKPL